MRSSSMVVAVGMRRKESSESYYEGKSIVFGEQLAVEGKESQR